MARSTLFASFHPPALILATSSSNSEGSDGD
jgi:hypothetical protein